MKIYMNQTIKNLIIVVVFILLTLSTSAAQSEGATLLIPSIDVTAPIGYAPIVDGTWDVSHLNMNVAVLESMPQFGTANNVVLAGHSEDSDGNPDIFYQLDQVNIGDIIYVQLNGQTLQYVVTERFNVSQRDLRILHPTNDDRLTLFTCDTDSYTKSGYLRRDVVVAKRVS